MISTYYPPLGRMKQYMSNLRFGDVAMKKQVLRAERFYLLPVSSYSRTLLRGDACNICLSRGLASRIDEGPHRQANNP